MKKYTFLRTCALAAYLIPLAAHAEIPPTWNETSGIQVRKDEMTRLYITPTRIVSTYAGTGGKLVRNAEALLHQGNGQAQMGQKDCCLMTSTENERASIVLDFGRELHGGVKLVMGTSSYRTPSLVRIRFGESVGEANSQTDNTEWRVGYATDDHAKRDIILEIPRDGMMELGNTGFRFVRIDLLENNRTIALKEASAILRYRDIPYLGTFQCSDTLLNRIWETGAYTVHLNMQEYLWDGIKRDRLVWLGDLHPELRTVTRVFGANEVVARSMDLACQQYPLPQWMNGMSAYSLWYLINQHDWYRQTGDMDYLRQHAPYISGLIHLIDTKVDADGHEHLSPSRFLDWPSSGNPKGVEAGYRALLIWAMQDAAHLSRILGNEKDVTLCEDIERRMKKIILPPNNLKQAAALMALAGTMPADRACDEVISVGGGKGFSTFYGYYMLEALAKAEAYDTALDIIRQFWGGMLAMGATTFWEDFNLEWMENAAPIDQPVPPGKKDIHGDFGAYCYPGFRHSLCHGWASGPTAWLTDHVLGVEIVDPAKRQVRITPHLGNLEWAQGTYPTPWGVIKVKHTRKANGDIQTSVRLPKGVKRVK